MKIKINGNEYSVKDVKIRKTIETYSSSEYWASVEFPVIEIKMLRKHKLFKELPNIISLRDFEIEYDNTKFAIYVGEETEKAIYNEMQNKKSAYITICFVGEGHEL